MSRHTVTLLSCEACIDGAGEEEEEEDGELQGGGGTSAWLWLKFAEEQKEEEGLTSWRQADLQSPRSC